MANHKSAAKRARQAPKRAARNSQAKSAVRSFEKKLKAAIESKNSDEAKSALQAYTSRIAKAAQKGAIKAPTASRRISRLSARVSQLSN